MVPDETPDQLPLALPGVNDGDGIFAVGESQVQMMSAFFDLQHNNSFMRGGQHASTGPWIQIPVAENDIRGGRDVLAPIFLFDPEWPGFYAPNLSTSLGEGFVVPFRRREKVVDASGAKGHDHLRTSLKPPTPGIETSARSNRCVQTLALTSRIVVDQNGISERKHEFLPSPVV